MQSSPILLTNEIMIESSEFKETSYSSLNMTLFLKVVHVAKEYSDFGSKDKMTALDLE